MQARYGDGAPLRVGLRHPSIAPYGAFTCSDGRELVLAIQNEREWERFCEHVLRDKLVAADSRFSDNTHRTQNREKLEALIQDVFDTITYNEVVDRMTESQTAYGAINSVHDLVDHPQLRTRPMRVKGRTVFMPALPYLTEWDDERFSSAPGLNEQGEALRSEFPVTPQ